MQLLFWNAHATHTLPWFDNSSVRAATEEHPSNLVELNLLDIEGAIRQ